MIKFVYKKVENETKIRCSILNYDFKKLLCYTHGNNIL